MAKILKSVVLTELLMLAMFLALSQSQTRDLPQLSQMLRRTARSISDSGSSEDTCGIADYEAIKGKLIQNYDVFDTFYQLFLFANASRLPRQNASHEAAFLDDSAMCQMLQNQPLGLEGRDPCPGVWELTRDPNRVPCLIRGFRCRCTECLLPPGLLDSTHQAQCQPIYNYVPVMRKIADEWRYSLEPVVVGCTCAGQRRTQILPTRY